MVWFVLNIFFCFCAVNGFVRMVVDFCCLMLVYESYDSLMVRLVIDYFLNRILFWMLERLFFKFGKGLSKIFVKGIKI